MSPLVTCLTAHATLEYFSLFSLVLEYRVYNVLSVGTDFEGNTPNLWSQKHNKVGYLQMDKSKRAPIFGFL